MLAPLASLLIVLRFPLLLFLLLSWIPISQAARIFCSIWIDLAFIPALLIVAQPVVKNRSFASAKLIRFPLILNTIRSYGSLIMSYLNHWSNLASAFLVSSLNRDLFA